MQNGSAMRNPANQYPYMNQFPQPQQPYQPYPQGQGPALPDGVVLQPLDEKTLNELRNGNFTGESAAEPSDQLQPLVPPEPPTAPVTGVFSKHLEEFIQNERNAMIFYQSLAEKSLTNRGREILKGIGENCGKRKTAFEKMYKAFTKEKFTPEETEIDIYIAFQDGVRLALYEESGFLRELSEIYDAMPDRQVALDLAAQIYRKIGDLNFLHLLNHA